MAVTYVTLYPPGGNTTTVQVVEGSQLHFIYADMGFSATPSAPGPPTRPDPFPQYVHDDEVQALVAGAAVPATDPVVAALLGNEGSQTSVALHAAYGAVVIVQGAGDGVADDSDAVAAAITKAGVGGTIVLRPTARYRVTRTMLLLSGQTLTGGGTLVGDLPLAEGTVVCNSATDINGGYTAAGGITIRGITIEAPTTNAIAFAHAANVLVDGVTFLDWYHHMVDLAGVKGARVVNCYGRNTVTSNIQGAGLQVDQARAGSSATWNGTSAVLALYDGTPSQDVLIQGNTIDGNAQSFGLHLHRGGHKSIAFIGNTVRGARIGYYADTDELTSDITVSNNKISDCPGEGIRHGGMVDGLVIIGNTVTDVTTDSANSHAINVQGIYGVDATRRLSDVTIADNIVRGFERTGIRVERINRRVTITGNVVSGARNATSRRGIALVNGQTATIAGNTVDLGIPYASAETAYSGGPGIYLAADPGFVTDDVTVVGNSLVNCLRGLWAITAVTGLSITGNSIRETAERGIYLSNGPGGATGFAAVSCTIANNTIRRCGITGIIADNPTDLAVNGNTIYDLTATAPSGRGIQAAGTGARVVISGNLVDGGAGSTVQSGIRLDSTITEVILTGNTVTRTTMGLDAATNTDLIMVGNRIAGNTGNTNFTLASQVVAANRFGTAVPVLSESQLKNTGGGRLFTGAGTPELVVTAPVGSIYLRTDGGAATTFYVKETGVGSAGWAAK